MARRGKVKLAFITNSSSRRASYQKRKKGILKKVSELSTLCGVKACAIIYSPYDPTPEIWPSPLGVQHVIAEYNRMPELRKKTLDQETFLRQRVSKLNEQITKIYEENRQKEMTELMNQCLADKNCLQKLMPEDVTYLQRAIDQKLKEVNRRYEAISRMARDDQLVAPPPPPQAQMPAITTGMLLTGGMQRQEQTSVVPQLSMPAQDHNNPRLESFGNLINNPIENMGFGNENIEEENMMAFDDNQTMMWSGPFYP